MKYDIKNLTLEEKMQLLIGRNGWQLSNANGKLPDVFLADGPNGLRMHDLTSPTRETKKATAMPNISLLCNTWDPELAFLDGATIGDECLENGADVLLAPGVNMKRTPLCGRNFEYFSEDPFLAGTMAKAYIEGVQSKGIGTSLKHFCANNSEYDRLYQSSEVDERTLREIYLPAFEIAVQAKPWTVMCSYNLINGVWASENKWLLNDILRNEFGFDGLIVSDWDATHSQYKATKASLDLTMPHRPEHYENLKEAYEKGWITEAEIDACVERVLALMEKVTESKKEVTTTKEERHQNAVKIAKEGMVLLKNEDGMLPLTSGNILISGTLKGVTPFGGGGSAFVQSDFKEQPIANLLSERLGDKAKFTTARTYGSVKLPSDVANLRATYESAYKADKVLLFVGTNSAVEAEGFDRFRLRLSVEQEDLILNTAKVNENVIVVLFAGSAVDMSPWIDKVKAVLFAGYAGEGGQEAVADLLTGIACPCGKLTETFPICLEDTPCGAYRGDGFVDSYQEGLFIGYRWYDKKQKEVLFPFGHGLSYANFDYSDLAIDKLGETDYEISYTITNTSSVPAKEISQVYVKDVFAMVVRPEKELKGYAKDLILPGESKRMKVRLNKRSFAYYSVPRKDWLVENGDFEILVGASSKDIRLKGCIHICLPDNEQPTH